jgi:hypothetical protein
VWIAFPVTDILSALLTAWLLKKEDCLKEGRKSISKQSIKSEIQP